MFQFIGAIQRLFTGTIKLLRTGGAESRLKIKPGTFFIVEKEGGSFYVMFAATDDKVLIYQPVIFPLEINGVFTFDSHLQIQGGSQPFIDIYKENPQDGSFYQDVWLNENEFYIDSGGGGYDNFSNFSEVYFHNKNDDRFYCYWINKQNGTRVWEAIFENGTFKCGIDLSTLRWELNLAGFIDMFLEYRIKNKKVVGERQPAIANLASNATLADTIAKTNQILATMRTHGLIEP
jgi:hypothetical protein